MNYNNVEEAVFCRRLNRFTAVVQLNGHEEAVHVKNTGRLKELFTSGARVLLSRSDNPCRKTAYDLVSVYFKDTLVNVDSLAPNKIASEYLRASWPDLTALRAEKVWNDSRFDFYGIRSGTPFYLEVKGVTLVQNGVALFPDAPTARGLKHVLELTDMKRTGTDTGILFIIQREDAFLFSPNWETQPDFGRALKSAMDAGVSVNALNCLVAPGHIEAYKAVRVQL